MEKISRAVMRAFGAKDNGTPVTSCVNDVQHTKQIFMLLGMAFAAGGLVFGYKGLPERVGVIESKLMVVQQEAITTRTVTEKFAESIDARLARIENALIRSRD